MKIFRLKDSVLTGIFIDSPVEGASYVTASQSGMTNSAGEFNYIAGEQVTFSIGETQFPAVTAAAEVSPVEIASGSPEPMTTTTNIARLLQSLDTDGNPENGITISDDASVNSAPLDFNASVEDFANDASVINLVANSGSVTTSLIDEASAIEHLESQVGELINSIDNSEDDEGFDSFEPGDSDLVVNRIDINTTVGIQQAFVANGSLSTGERMTIDSSAVVRGCTDADTFSLLRIRTDIDLDSAFNDEQQRKIYSGIEAVLLLTQGEST